MAFELNDENPPEGRPEVMRKLGSAEFREELRQADVILGRDEETDNQFLVFGRSTLQAIVQSGVSMVGKVLYVPILQRTLELEALIAAVQVARGYDDYEAAPPLRKPQ